MHDGMIRISALFQADGIGDGTRSEIDLGDISEAQDVVSALSDDELPQCIGIGESAGYVHDRRAFIIAQRIGRKNIVVSLYRSDHLIRGDMFCTQLVRVEFDLEMIDSSAADLIF